MLKNNSSKQTEERKKKKKRNAVATVNCVALSCDFHCETMNVVVATYSKEKKKRSEDVVANDGCMSHVHILLMMEEINNKKKSIYTLL